MNLLIKIFLRGPVALKERILKLQVKKYLWLLKNYYTFRIGHNVRFNGMPIITMSKEAAFHIGSGCVFNSGFLYNLIGRQQPCIFTILSKGSITIGENVGMSSTAIFSLDSVVIEDGVMIGGNTVIYDTDFHSLSGKERSLHDEDINAGAKARVLIKKNAFIGAHATILKGVTIGENAIVGACSLVTKSIPDNEIWAGNPARFIRKAE